MIRSVILDFGGVYFTDGTSKAIKEISTTYGVPEQSVTEVLHGNFATEYRIGAMTADPFWSGAKEYWGIDAKGGVLSRASADEIEEIFLFRSHNLTLAKKQLVENSRLSSLAINPN